MIHRKLTGIRLYLKYSLIFFMVVGLTRCASSSEKDKIQIRWSGKSAEAVLISKELVKELAADSVSNHLKIRLVHSGTPVAILGDYRVEAETIVFTPLIPFTRGLQYEVRLDGRPIGTFEVPRADRADAPQLLGIFPSQDTLPENLLKVYLRFSQPMQEGKSENFVHLVRGNADTLKGAFLHLQPELWNEDRTVLTLWLDPGRIKRDLQPNQLLGAPLQKNERYQLLVAAAWQDQQGTSLPKTYAKSFVTSLRDSLSPDPHTWQVPSPRSGTSQAVIVGFGESLDYSLIPESLQIRDEEGRTIEGTWKVGKEEKTGTFSPANPWKAGKYYLRVGTVLEDLAGNNINRPFDQEVTSQNSVTRTDAFVDIPFSITK